MRVAAKLGFALIAGLVLAGIVHLSAVLAIPILSERDAFSRLAASVESDNAELIASGGESAWLPLPDPAVSVAACAYDLEDGAIRVSTRVTTLFQSLALHTRRGIHFALTDRAAIRGSLEVVVMTRAQYDEAVAEEDEPSRDVRVVSPANTGLVVLRVLAATPSQRAEAEASAKAVTCALDDASNDEQPAPASP